MPIRNRITLSALLFTVSIWSVSPLSAIAQEVSPPVVRVLKLKSHPVPVTSVLPGRIAATRVSEVRSRVSGILSERVFEQGSSVRKGDVLYRIDPRVFKIRVASAEASLAKAKVIQANASQQFNRAKMLRESNVVSVVEYDTAAANKAQADADIAFQQAALDEANLNLEYTEIRAPISGIIGGALVTEGALVSADGTSDLALIQQIDPVYADFTQSALDLLNQKQAAAAGKLRGPAADKAIVELIYDDGSVYREPGKLLFSSASVDASTGQVTLRAEFPNPSEDLLPGMYVRVRINQATRQDGITIPQRAVTRDAQGNPSVYVVTPDGIAQVRTLKLGPSLGFEWLVHSGLKDAETIIVDGTQKVAPDQEVTVGSWKPDDINAGTQDQARK